MATHNFVFREGTENSSCYSENDFYALKNGYCEGAVEALKYPADRKLVEDAVRILEAFFDQARDEGVIEEM